MIRDTLGLPWFMVSGRRGAGCTMPEHVKRVTKRDGNWPVLCVEHSQTGNRDEKSKNRSCRLLECQKVEGEVLKVPQIVGD
jgi:hypothetical protein